MSKDGARDEHQAQRRVRDAGLPRPDWVKQTTGGLLRDHLTAASLKMQAFAASVHPDDQNLARIVKTLDIGLDDYVALVRALRDPGSATPLNRPRGSSRFAEQDDTTVRRLAAELRRPIERKDCEAAARACPRPFGNSYEADTNRTWRRAQALGLAANKSRGL